MNIWKWPYENEIGQEELVKSEVLVLGAVLLDVMQPLQRHVTKKK